MFGRIHQGLGFGHLCVNQQARLQLGLKLNFVSFGGVFFNIEGLTQLLSALLQALNLHLKGSWIKATIGLGKGRKLHDKRHEERRKQDIKDAKAAIARL